MVFSQEIINVLDYLCRKFGIAIDWTSENIMPLLKDLCERYIQYEVYTSIAWCVAFASIVVIAGLIWFIANIIDKHSTSVSYIPETFRFIFFAALAIGVIIWMVQAFDIIECYTIPEKTILEYLNRLMNTAK